MIAYLVRRVLQAIVVMIGVSLIVFLLFHLLPGGPAQAVLGFRANPATIRAFDAEYGLLKPLPVQYADWLGQLLRGNLGYSYKQSQSVDSLLAENVPRTLVLVGTATLLALLVAIPMGTYQAVRRNKPDDYALTAMTFFFYSMPSFLLGIILILLFSDTLPWLPSTGPTATNPMWDQLPNLVLPVLTLMLVTLALFSRYMRSSTLENLIQDYVRTAKAKGVPGARILFLHALPNALMPVITLVGLSLAQIASGAVVVESLFNYPGLGLLFWNACQTDDFPVMIGTIMVVALAVVVGSLLADVLYAVVDPRVRYTS